MCITTGPPSSLSSGSIPLSYLPHPSPPYPPYNSSPETPTHPPAQVYMYLNAETAYVHLCAVHHMCIYPIIITCNLPLYLPTPSPAWQHR